MPKKGSKNSKMQGGAGAADYAIAVYGNTNDQHALPGTNVIAAKAVGGRGRKQKQQQQEQQESQGGNIITDIAVPAILITGNQLYKRKRTNKKYRKSQKSRKNRRSTYRRR
jgi:hypothetical protein